MKFEVLVIHTVTQRAFASPQFYLWPLDGTRGVSVVKNNHIHHTGELLRTVYAVVLDGVGNTVARNLIQDCPIGGVSYGGNARAIIDNEIHNLGFDAGVMGGIYTNGYGASRDTLIRGNFGHHAPGVNGAYPDDGHSGDVVGNKMFYRVCSGLLLGGGHDNVGTLLPRVAAIPNLPATRSP